MSKSELPVIDASFWNHLFAQDNMPWDRTQSPLQLVSYLTKSHIDEDDKKLRVFIPGCGCAYEVLSFIEHGYNVTAMDYSEQAVNRAKSQLGEHSDVVLLGDVFAAQFKQQFDLIYERAFLAALPRELWGEYFIMIERLLPSGGILLGYFVISDDYHSRYPPFCLRSGELNQYLEAKFEFIETCSVSDSVDVFAGKEYWMIWKKK